MNDCENPSSQLSVTSPPQMHPNGSQPNGIQSMEDAFNRPVNPEALQMVLSYLRRNGLTETEEQLQREAGHMIKNEHSGGLRPEEAITLEFEQFIEHANACTDVVQAEFSQLIFPIFAHCSS
uniref:LisH domain-containing protein n=1 Tax=Caenorhabditis japonica TaxID=281687 RepID=A0A8R1IDD4_CAEJA